MSYPINYPTPQGANVQIFRGQDANTTAHVATRDWVKPQGASFVWFTLIGAGGGGGGGVDTLYIGGGGASGNVTNFMCPAFLIPDVLQVAIGKGGSGGSGVSVPSDGTDGSSGDTTQIIYQQKNGAGYQLLLATGGGGGGAGKTSIAQNGQGGAAAAFDTGGPMTAAGFFNATAGQNGAGGGAIISVDSTTFVMAGSGVNSSTVINGYYGYSAKSDSGFSQISPIINTISGGGFKTGNKYTGTHFGCGGVGGDIDGGGRGGDGLAIIVTW
jgi:hypothetical protein